MTSQSFDAARDALTRIVRDHSKLLDRRLRRGEYEAAAAPNCWVFLVGSGLLRPITIPKGDLPCQHYGCG